LPNLALPDGEEAIAGTWRPDEASVTVTAARIRGWMGFRQVRALRQAQREALGQ